MRTIRNPVEIFEVIDVTTIDEDSFDFILDEPTGPDELTDEELAEDDTVERVTVEFEWLTDENELFESALSKLEDAASDVDDTEDIPFTPTSTFTHNGQTYYMRDGLVGYESIREIRGIHMEENLHDCVPRRTAFTVLHPENVVRVGNAPMR